MQQNQIQIEQLKSSILEISPIQQTNALIILTEQAHLYYYEIELQLLKHITLIELPDLVNQIKNGYKQSKYQLYSSMNGLYVAVVVDYGQFGIILNTETGNIILRLDGKNYHEDTVPFSIAFTRIQNEDIVIYRSDWNRLETFNLTNNKSTTNRNIASHDGQSEPEHYLDYFHGALYVSPNGLHILDDGWIWHPIGIPRTWSLTEWSNKNAFESEDGASLQKLCYRENWDLPLCWLDNDTIALWHIELWDDDEYESINKLGIHIRSLKKGNPDLLWEMPEQIQEIFHIYATDKHLIVVGSENISFYDIASQTLTAQLKNHRKQKQHLARNSLFSFEGKVLYEIKILFIKNI